MDAEQGREIDTTTEMMEKLTREEERNEEAITRDGDSGRNSEAKIKEIKRRV